MRFYDMVLLLFIFGAMCQAINTIGGYAVSVPASSTSITQANVQDMETALTGTSPLNFFFIYQMIVSIGSIILMGALAVLSIIPLGLIWTTALGINPLVAIPVIMTVQIPIWWVMINGYYQMVTGHPYKVME